LIGSHPILFLAFPLSQLHLIIHLRRPISAIGGGFLGSLTHPRYLQPGLIPRLGCA
jgi:hypothetical protein